MLLNKFYMFRMQSYTHFLGRSPTKHSDNYFRVHRHRIVLSVGIFHCQPVLDGTDPSTTQLCLHVVGLNQLGHNVMGDDHPHAKPIESKVM